jgi:hypothetical protein
LEVTRAELNEWAEWVGRFERSADFKRQFDPATDKLLHGGVFQMLHWMEGYRICLEHIDAAFPEKYDGLSEEQEIAIRLVRSNLTHADWMDDYRHKRMTVWERIKWVCRRTS